MTLYRHRKYTDHSRQPGGRWLAPSLLIGEQRATAKIVADLLAAHRGSWWRRDLGIQDDDYDRALEALAGRYERGDHIEHTAAQGGDGEK